MQPAPLARSAAQASSLKPQACLRIAIVARTAKHKGGTETYLFDLVRGFRAAGHAVDVYAAADSRTSPATAAGATVHVSPLTLVPNLIRPWVLRAALARIDRSRYDLTISLARVNGQDLAVCGGTHRGYLQAMGRRPKLRDRSEIALEERCYRESGLIVAHSQRMRQELLELYQVDPAKVVVIHPPVDSDVYHPGNPANRLAAKRRFGLSPRRTALLFPSTGHERKGLVLLLDALAELPADQFELVVAGSDSGQFRRLDNVRYLGFVDNMAELYRAADVTVLPAHYEPFGLVISESLACDTPVITHRGVGACDVVGPREGIVLDELTVPALCEALLTTSSGHFAIARDFVRQRGLGLAQHVERLIQSRSPLRRAA